MPIIFLSSPMETRLLWFVQDRRCLGCADTCPWAHGKLGSTPPSIFKIGFFDYEKNLDW